MPLVPPPPTQLQPCLLLSSARSCVKTRSLVCLVAFQLPIFFVNFFPLFVRVKVTIIAHWFVYEVADIETFPMPIFAGCSAPNARLPKKIVPTTVPRLLERRPTLSGIVRDW